MPRLFLLANQIIVWPASVLPMAYAAAAPQPSLVNDFYTDKARYCPGDNVVFSLALANKTKMDLRGAQAVLACYDLGVQTGAPVDCGFDIAVGQQIGLQLSWPAPAPDYRGYLADVRILDAGGKELDRAVTAVDVSSDWARFPRYGYLAHFSAGIDTDAWIAELNKYHINGLQFYDFQYKHHLPLAGTVQQPAARWGDIAGRPTSRDTVLGFIDAAHKRNMTAMAYNASYGAYTDAFSDRSGVKLEWATWSNDWDDRVEGTIKLLGPLPAGWATPKLYYMNQNLPAWQDYIVGRMGELFKVYPFDGWHIDTYGDASAYAYDGSYIDYIAGFNPFVENARQRLGKKIVFNTVGANGQETLADSSAEFVYSELWDGHPSYNSLLRGADAIHDRNPKMAVVFPAYMHSPLVKELPENKRICFNTPSVLLTDAIMSAAGAFHFELGDDGMMLPTEYFPENEKTAMSPELQTSLRRYSDFIVAYENYLRHEVAANEPQLSLGKVKTSSDGMVGTIWCIGRKKGPHEMVHLINLTGRRSEWWRDDMAGYGDTELQRNLQARLRVNGTVDMLGWASPDVDGGRFNKLEFKQRRDSKGAYVDFVVPSLKYWDMIIVRYKNALD